MQQFWWGYTDEINIAFVISTITPTHIHWKTTSLEVYMNYVDTCTRELCLISDSILSEGSSRKQRKASQIASLIFMKTLSCSTCFSSWGHWAQLLRQCLPFTPCFSIHQKSSHSFETSDSLISICFRNCNDSLMLLTGDETQKPLPGVLLEAEIARSAYSAVLSLHRYRTRKTSCFR